MLEIIQAALWGGKERKGIKGRKDTKHPHSLFTFLCVCIKNREKHGSMHTDVAFFLFGLTWDMKGKLNGQFLKAIEKKVWVR